MGSSSFFCRGPGFGIPQYRLAERPPLVRPSRIKPGAVDRLPYCLDGRFPWDFVQWVTDLNRLVGGFDPLLDWVRMLELIV